MWCEREDGVKEGGVKEGGGKEGGGKDVWCEKEGSVQQNGVPVGQMGRLSRECGREDGARIGRGWTRG